jgi:hypothetical protein
MNAILSIVLTFIACAMAFIWLQPEAAELMALKLRARAAAVRAARAAYKAAYSDIYREVSR